MLETWKNENCSPDFCLNGQAASSNYTTAGELDQSPIYRKEDTFSMNSFLGGGGGSLEAQNEVGGGKIKEAIYVF